MLFCYGNIHITLDSLAISGPVELLSIIRTTGDQIYGGQLSLATTGLNTFILQSQLGSIEFNGLIDAGANSKDAKRSLDVQAGSGSIRVTERIGLDITNMASEQYVSQTGTSPWALSMTARDIYLSADITTYETQTYTGDIWVAANPEGEPAITLTSMDPAVMFMGRINDTEAGKHTLNVAAITTRTDRSELPQVRFGAAVGDVNPLGGLNVLVGMQMPNPQSRVGELSPDLTQAIGRISIADSVTTENNQFYQADMIAIGTDVGQSVVLTSRKGTVTMVLGQRVGSGITSVGNFTVAERVAATSNPEGDNNNAVGDDGNGESDITHMTSNEPSDLNQAGVAAELEQLADPGITAGLLEHRVVSGEQAAQTRTEGQGQPSAWQSSEVLFEAQVEVGDIESFTCEVPPSSITIELEDCQSR